MKHFFILLIALVCYSPLTLASNQANNETSPRTALETAGNFGAVYLTQWSVYLVTQEETIRTHGSWDKFFDHMAKPTFDKDSFDYNILKHTLVGQYYYLFYRFRGYSKGDAFLWTFLSSLAFEFAVETYTEQPSIQDIYQTPIYGTLVGMLAEQASDYLHSRDSILLHGLAYILNPFTILTHLDLHFSPRVDKDSVGLQAIWRF